MFWVYENWHAGPHKAVIHSGTCAFCNNGAGRARGYDPRFWIWHPSFERQRDFNPPEQRAAQRALPVCRPIPAPGGPRTLCPLDRYAPRNENLFSLGWQVT